MMMVSIYLFSIFLLLRHAAGFATWFTTDYCDTPLVAGEIIMNHEATRSDDRKIEVYRGTKLLVNGDTYMPGEVLTAVLNGEDAGEMVFESNFGVFEGGGCENERSTLSTSTIIIPEDLTDPLELWAGWAYSHSTVWISAKFILLHPQHLVPRSNVHPNTAAAAQEEQQQEEKNQDKLRESNKIAQNSEEIIQTEAQTQTKHLSQQALAQAQQEQSAEALSKKYNTDRQMNKHKTLTDQSQLYGLMEGYLLFIGVLCAAAVVFILWYYQMKIATLLGFKDDINLMKSY